jgi:DNA polymerase-3 subunit delta'
LSFDLDGYTAARAHALVLLNSSLRGTEHSELFKTTETYRPGADGREKTDALLRTLHSLLEDMLFLHSGAPQLVRNSDILGELRKMAEAADFEWIRRAAEGLGEVESGMRRNLLRSLSLDAFAVALERTS